MGFRGILLSSSRRGEIPELAEGLAKIAGIRGSWRAQLWQARTALQHKDLATAMTLYEQSLANTDVPVPADALMQITGDLGNQGYLAEILQLAEPRFDIDAARAPTRTR